MTRAVSTINKSLISRARRQLDSSSSPDALDGRYRARTRINSSAIHFLQLLQPASLSLYYRLCGRMHIKEANVNSIRTSGRRGEEVVRCED